jgi:hypothetical protein
MERCFQARTHRLAPFVAIGPQTHCIARMIVHDRQRMASCAIRQRHATLEVHLPQQVRRLLLKPLPRLSGRATPRINAAVAAQNRMHRRGGRSLVPSVLKTSHDLARAPYRMSVAHRKHCCLGQHRAVQRAEMRPPRAVRKLVLTRSGPRQPFVASLVADAEPLTQRTAIRPLLISQPHKLTSLVHNRHLAPRHGRPSFAALPRQC